MVRVALHHRRTSVHQTLAKFKNSTVLCRILVEVAKNNLLSVEEVLFYSESIALAVSLLHLQCNRLTCCECVAEFNTSSTLTVIHSSSACGYIHKQIAE